MTNIRNNVKTYLFVVTVLLASAQVTAKQGTNSVNCDKGQSIQDAVDKASPDEVIEITGTCIESVTISTDGVVLSGQNTVGDPDIRAPSGDSNYVIGVFARNVEIRNIVIDANNSSMNGIQFGNAASGVIFEGEVQNALLDGVQINDGSHVSIDQFEVGNVASAAITVNGGSFARITNTSVSVSYGGLFVRDGSSVVTIGLSVTTHEFGIGLQGSSSAVLIDTQSTMNNADGLIVQQSSSAGVDGGSYSNNGRSGIHIITNSSVFLPGAADAVTINSNMTNGIFCSASAALEPQTAPNYGGGNGLVTLPGCDTGGV